MEFLPNYANEFSFYLTANIISILYKHQSVNSVQGNNHYYSENCCNTSISLGLECRVT